FGMRPFIETYVDRRSPVPCLRAASGKFLMPFVILVSHTTRKILARQPLVGCAGASSSLAFPSSKPHFENFVLSSGFNRNPCRAFLPLTFTALNPASRRRAPNVLSAHSFQPFGDAHT